jgi:hypothetical protein
MRLNIITVASDTGSNDRSDQPMHMVRVRTQDQEQRKAASRSCRGGVSWLTLQGLLGGLALALVLLPGPLAAQTNRAKALPPNRFLLIVDASRSMQRRADATLKVVQDVVRSGLNGQCRRGDTFGLWTFNEALYAGQFPLQSWSRETGGEVAALMIAYLKNQKCEKAAVFDKVLPALAYVVEHSPHVTVILISCGEEKMNGTPFDKPINEYYQRLRSQQQKARMPFVTVFKGQGGRLVDYTVNTPPWPLQLPSAPPEAETAEMLKARLQEALQKGPSTSAPPVTVSGKKPEPESAPATEPEVPAAKVEVAGPVAGSSNTNRPTGGGRLPPAEPVTQVTTTPTAPPTAQLPKIAPAPLPAAAPKVEVIKAPQAKAIPLAPVPTNGAPVALAPALPPKPQASAVVQPKPAVPSVPKPPATPAPPPLPEVSAHAASNVSGAAVAPSRPAPASACPSAQPNRFEQAAAVVPGGRLGLGLGLGALALALVAALFAVLWLRRTPPPPSGSLITRSYDRGRKP